MHFACTMRVKGIEWHSIFVECDIKCDEWSGSKNEQNCSRYKVMLGTSYISTLYYFGRKGEVIKMGENSKENIFPWNIVWWEHDSLIQLAWFFLSPFDSFYGRPSSCQSESDLIVWKSGEIKQKMERKNKTSILQLFLLNNFFPFPYIFLPCLNDPEKKILSRFPSFTSFFSFAHFTISQILFALFPHSIYYGLWKNSI